MSFDDFLHKFFHHNNGENIRPPENEGNLGQPFDPFWNPSNPNRDPREFSPFLNMEVLMDPIKMQGLFQEKFHEMLKDFAGSENFFNIQGSDMFETPDVPAIEGPQSPRDQCLKPGIKDKPTLDNGTDASPSTRFRPSNRFELLLKPEFGENSSGPQNFSSFTSVTRKTIRLPDGSIRTEEIRRNPDGTEERTESHTLPDERDLPFVNPQIPGWFQAPELPSSNKRWPKDQFLKPGFEKPSPSGDKVDKDLDKELQQSGLTGLPMFSPDSEVTQPNPTVTYKSFTKKITTLPSGAVKVEEAIRNPDGSEQRTVTETSPDNLKTSPLVDAFKIDLPENHRQSSLSSAIKNIMDSLFR